VQRAQLHHDEEQEDDHGSPGVLEVLQALPLPQEAQGNEVSQGSAFSFQGSAGSEVCELLISKELMADRCILGA
jgi:hypothetical protein